MDSENQFIKDASIKKVCCCFGNKAEWDSLPELGRFSPTQLFDEVLPRMETIIFNATLPPGPCGEEHNEYNGPDLCGEWNNGNIVITREGNKFVARRYNLPQQFLNKGWRNGCIRMEIFIDGFERASPYPTWNARLLQQNASGRFYYQDVKLTLSSYGIEGSRPYEELAARYSGTGLHAKYVKFRRYK